MKKIIAIICAAAMFFTFAFGANAADLDFLDKEYKSYDATVEFSMQLNKPFDFVKALSDELSEARGEDAGMIDYQYLYESLTRAKFTADVQAQTSDDRMSAKLAMAVSANIPIEFSEDLQIAVGTKVKMWMDYDFSDEKNLKFDMIITNPLNGKYYYLDYIKLLDALDEENKSLVADMIKSLDNKSGASEIVSVVKNVLTGNAKISSEGNTRTIELTGDAMGDYLSGLFEGVIKSDYMKSVLKDICDAAGESEPYEITDEDIKEITDAIKALRIFADDAVSIKCTLDDDGFIREADEKMHFAFNIAELCEGVELDAVDIYTLTKENSDVDFTLSMKETFHRVKDVTVTMPSPAEEKKVNLTEALLPQPEPEPEPEYEYEYEYDRWYRTTRSFTNNCYDAEPIDVSKKEFYVHFESFFNETLWNDDYLSGSVTVGEDGSITVEYESKALEKTTLTAKPGETAYSVNGAMYEAKHPFKLSSYEREHYDWETGENKTETVDSVYVGCDVLETLFGCRLYSYTVYFTEEGETEYAVTLERPNPGYNPDYGAEEEAVYLN